MDVQLIMKRIGADGNAESLVGEEEEGSQNAAGGRTRCSNAERRASNTSSKIIPKLLIIKV
jgi:hypothetical protein